MGDGQSAAPKTCFSPASRTREAYRGRFEKAREFSQRAVESARHADAREPAAGWKANEALREAEIGDKDPGSARRQRSHGLDAGTGCEGDHGVDPRPFGEDSPGTEAG